MIVNDRVGALGASGRSELESISSPFRVKATFESATSKAALQADMAACVDTPNTICIGVDPGHRFTWTEIGTDTGIAGADYQQVARAGNPDFHEARWADGVKSIVSRAKVLAHHGQATGVVVQEHKMVVEKPVPAWPFVLGFGVLTSFVVTFWWLQRRQARRLQQAAEDMQREAAEYASKNIKADEAAEFAAPATVSRRASRTVTSPRAQAYAPPPMYVAPVRDTVVVNNSSNGFIEGILVGEALSRPTYVRERTPPPPYSRSSSSDNSSSSWSDSGSSSSWDSDSGGGGGGGFDSSSGGGGGGDF